MFSIQMATQKYKYFTFIRFCSNDCIIKELEQVEDVDNPKNQDGSTLLMFTAKQGKLEIFEYLLKRGANLLAINTTWSNTLILATKNNHINIAKKILSFKISERLDKGEPLFNACTNNNLDMVKLLIKHNADPNNHQIHHKNLLIACVRFSSISIIRYLLQHDAYTETRSFTRWTPLTIASYENKQEIVKLLRTYGADADYKGPGGLVAINFARDFDYPEIHSFLNISKRWSIFQTAIACRYTQDLSWLIKNGNINPKHYSKQVMLEFAQKENLWINQPKKDDQILELIELIYLPWKPEKHFLVSKKLDKCINCFLLVNQKLKELNKSNLPTELMYMIFRQIL